MAAPAKPAQHLTRNGGTMPRRQVLIGAPQNRWEAVEHYRTHWGLTLAGTIRTLLRAGLAADPRPPEGER